MKKVACQLARAVPPPLVAGCAPEGLTTEGRAAHDAYNGFLMAAALVFRVVAVRLLVGGACRRRNEELPQQTRGNIPGTTNEFDMNFQRVGLYHASAPSSAASTAPGCYAA